jgi:hypothetical protein
MAFRTTAAARIGSKPKKNSRCLSKREQIKGSATGSFRQK